MPHDHVHVKKSTVTRVLRSVSKKGAQSKEHEIVDLDVEESVSERVARLITNQAGANYIRVAPHLKFEEWLASPLACLPSLTSLQAAT